MRIGDADLGVGARAHFARHQEGDDPRHVALERQHLEIEHQLRMLGKRRRDAAARPVHRRQLDVDLFLRLLNPPLDVTNGVEVLRQLAGVGRPEPPAQPLHFVDERIQDAAIVPDPGETRRPGRVVAVAEQALEHRARLVLHRQRRRRVAPRQRVGIGAAVAGLARADQLVRIEAQLQRGQLRVLAERLRGKLIHRHAGANVGAFGLLRVNAGEECGRRAHVIAGAFAGGRKRRPVRQPGDDEHALTEGPRAARASG